MEDRTIAVPRGFSFAAVEAAIKKPGRKDLALICSDVDAAVAGMFTTNKVKAAPVVLGRERIKSGKGRAIVVNSGNANACTGAQGMKDAVETAELAARHLGITGQGVYVCSTGVIGNPMPMDRIRPKLAELAGRLGTATIHDVASAIMTTDSFPKLMSSTKKIGGKPVTITGVCKGAGMIQPNMATMLAFLMTDAKIASPVLRSALREAVKVSFNRLSVDGDMSTNDTVLLMANGHASNEAIRAKTKEFNAFVKALSEVSYGLARMIARDGEGATKVLIAEVKNAKTEKDAEIAARAIANSLLVKTAVYGNDANWGRVMAAVGYSGSAMQEDKVDVYLNGLRVAKNGMPTGVDAEANEKLKTAEVVITVDLHLGKGTARVLSCDLTEEYIRINAEYRT